MVGEGVQRVSVLNFKLDGRCMLFYIPFLYTIFIQFCKESASNVGEPGSIPRSGRSPGEEWQPTPVFLPGEFHGQRRNEKLIISFM